MNAVITEDGICSDNLELHNRGGYGRKENSKLILSFEEAVYLLEKGRIEVFEDGRSISLEELFLRASKLIKDFEIKYAVYRDLRERGYCVQPGIADFRLYPRGGKPGKTPSEYLVLVISERRSIPLEELVEKLEICQRIKKKLILAIVDEETDITYYEARWKVLKGETRELSDERFQGYLLNDRVIFWDERASEVLHQKYFFGELVNSALYISLVEAVYLMSKGILELKDAEGREVSEEELLRRGRELEENFDEKFEVYRDLRDKRMVVKTGFKFGAHFRVYDKVESVEELYHSKHLVHVIRRDHVFSPQELSRAVRLAHGVRKSMVFAFGDGEKRYIEIRRVRL
ncbi:MAG: tRNA-intron endonuclease, archaea type [Archaeoglobi archaeon]|nr:tRNA-intron lyase [Candidatus Mnemosynella bozhongmuii]MDK2781093.1 tRNA-intron endonuclease, archaea type [Archaeoglobi archaeon]